MNKRDARILREKASVASEQLRAEVTRSKDNGMDSVAAMHTTVLRAIQPDAYSRTHSFYGDAAQVWKDAKPWQRWAAGIGTVAVIALTIGSTVYFIKQKADTLKRQQEICKRCSGHF